MKPPPTARIAVVLATISLLGSGCAPVSTDEGFVEVRDAVAERIGMRVEWDQGTAADAAVDSSVRELLRHALTADVAVQIGLLNNRELRATWEDLGIAQASLVQAGLLANPVFAGNAKFFLNGPTEVEFGIARSFLDVFDIPLRKHVAAAQFDAVKRWVTGRTLGFASLVRTALYDVQADEQMLEMRRGVLEAMNASLALAERLRATGNIRAIDLANEQNACNQARLDLAAAEASTSEDRERLTSLMGLWGNDIEWRVAARLPELPADEIDVHDVEKRAVAMSLELARSRCRIAATAQELGLTEWRALFPDLEAGVAVKKETDGSWGLGPAVAVPLPLFDQGQARIASGQAMLRRDFERHLALALDIRSAARAARSKLLAARSRAVFFRDAVLPLREQIVQQTQLEYNGMLTGAFQLLAAKAQEIDGGRQSIEALRDYWRAREHLALILNGWRPSARAIGESPDE